jgi:hypothetical protein
MLFVHTSYKEHELGGVIESTGASYRKLHISGGIANDAVVPMSMDMQQKAVAPASAKHAGQRCDSPNVVGRY